MSAIQTVLSDATPEICLLHSLVVGHVCTSVRVSAAMFTYLISEINEHIYTYFVSGWHLPNFGEYVFFNFLHMGRTLFEAKMEYSWLCQ
jgi:hypothetical protein